MWLPAPVWCGAPPPPSTMALRQPPPSQLLPTLARRADTTPKKKRALLATYDHVDKEAATRLEEEDGPRPVLFPPHPVRREARAFEFTQDSIVPPETLRQRKRQHRLFKIVKMKMLVTGRIAHASAGGRKQVEEGAAPAWGGWHERWANLSVRRNPSGIPTHVAITCGKADFEDPSSMGQATREIVISLPDLEVEDPGHVGFERSTNKTSSRDRKAEEATRATKRKAAEKARKAAEKKAKKEAGKGGSGAGVGKKGKKGEGSGSSDGGGHREEEEAAVHAALKVLFDTLDKDKNGVVDKGEILGVLRNPDTATVELIRGVPLLADLLKPQHFAATFNAMDTNKDGSMQFDELLSFCEKGQHRQQPIKQPATSALSPPPSPLQAIADTYGALEGAAAATPIQGGASAELAATPASPVSKKSPLLQQFNAAAAAEAAGPITGAAGAAGATGAAASVGAAASAASGLRKLKSVKAAIGAARLLGNR